jgi:hypothetical protein
MLVFATFFAESSSQVGYQKSQVSKVADPLFQLVLPINNQTMLSQFEMSLSDNSDVCKSTKIYFFNYYYRVKEKTKREYYFSKIPFDCLKGLFQVTRDKNKIERSDSESPSDLILVPEDFDWGNANQIYVEFQDTIRGKSVAKFIMRSQDHTVFKTNKPFTIGDQTIKNFAVRGDLLSQVEIGYYPSTSEYKLVNFLVALNPFRNVYSQNYTLAFQRYEDDLQIIDDPDKN